MILHSPSLVQAGPRLGAHVSIAGGLPLAIDRGIATGCEALQIFSKSSNQWRARPLPDDEVLQFRQRYEESGIKPVLAHASYLINLGSPDKRLWRRSVDALEQELQRADLLGLSGVVLHPGAYTSSTEEEGLNRIVEGITEVFSNLPNQSARLLLEHTAGQGTVLGHRFEHLRSIMEPIGNDALIGVCLDTCHLVAAGYDIISAEGYVEVFNQFDSIVGLQHLSAFHLNDSKKPLGSRVDRHANIGHGHIGTAPFSRLVRDTRFTGLPMLLETPKAVASPGSVVEADPMDLENLDILRRLS